MTNARRHRRNKSEYNFCYNFDQWKGMLANSEPHSPPPVFDTQLLEQPGPMQKEEEKEPV